MRELKWILILAIFATGPVMAQQEFFLSTWKPKIIQIPEHTEALKTSQPANVSLTINAGDTITRIPLYMFGDNANAYTGSMSDNKKLIDHLADRNMGVLRGPSGSISDVYFWNRSEYQRPADVPNILVGGSDSNWLWWGKRPNSWDAGWTMDVDSFYSILEKAGVTGMITVNYGYARYGTSEDPVAQAAHMAADWVRYDRGRTKFWEIGNEVFGSWEAGYRIDTTLNKDGQPEYINGTLYGQHCRTFIDSMKATAIETGAEIFIGAVAVESAGSNNNNWNEKLMAEVGDIIDFYIIHSYYTPWQQNSRADTILNSAYKTKGYIDYISSCADRAGAPTRPVALTEYNIFAIGSNQMVSQINGMHAVLVTGEAIKNKLGAACRWDLANGYSNGDDHGMFSYGNEPGVEKYAPRPAFYYLYYMQKNIGDILLKTDISGSKNVIAYSSRFSSGQLSTTLINKGPAQFITRINTRNATVGNQFYTYTLTGGDDIPQDPAKPFSRKVLVNGTGPSGVAGGPSVYDTIRAKLFETGDEILVETPPYSVTYVLIDTGNIQLEINNKFSPRITWNNPADIIYGTLLSEAQLNATAIIEGTFIYDPPSGTLLPAGDGQELHALFSPNDSTDYNSVTKTVKINVTVAGDIYNLMIRNPHIFPVPVTDALTIDHSVLSGQGQKVMVHIQNIDGRLIHSMVSVNDGNPIEISVRDLPAGIYILHLQTEQMSFTERFIKQ
jgi:hypothetical protein